MPHIVALTMSLLFGSVVTSPGCTASQSECRSEADCPDRHHCVPGGGVIVAGGRCLPDRLLETDTLDAPDSGAPADSAEHDGSDLGIRPDLLAPDVPSRCPDRDGCSCAFDDTSTGVCSDGTIVEGDICRPPSTYGPDEVRCSDGLDNDCDGDVDAADESCACSPGAAESCYTGPDGTERVGVCNDGIRQCGPSGTWSECRGETLPSADEDCATAADDDCRGDGNAGCPCNYDDDFEGVCAGASLDATGVCRKPDAYDSTDDEGGADNCDGLDNDCDGTVDEHCDCNFGETSTGVCGRAAIDSTTGECTEPSAYEASENTCDDIDNDCDGEVDENCDRDGDGYCGADAPVVGSPSVCPDSAPNTGDDCDDGDASVHPGADDICDGADNDCDGTADESTVDGGGSCTGDCQCLSNRCSGGTCLHRLFLTSVRYDGDLGGVSGNAPSADAKCNGLADDANLGGNWKAILSDSGSDAADRLAIRGAIRNMNGTKLADDATDLWGALDDIVAYDERGNDRTSGSMGDWAWTGSTNDARNGGRPHCSNWTSSASGETGAVGDAGESAAVWIRETYLDGLRDCNTSNRLYCIDGQ